MDSQAQEKSKHKVVKMIVLLILVNLKFHFKFTRMLIREDIDKVEIALSRQAVVALLGHPIVGPSWEGFVIENL